MLIYGLNLGCIYALLAVGYSLVYGVLCMPNFTHGHMMMLGAYCLFFTHRLGLPLWLCLIFALLFCGVLSLITEASFFRPVRGNGSYALVSAIAVGLLYENLATMLFAADYRLLPLTPSLKLLWLTPLITGLLLLLLYLLLYHSKIGMAVRAVGTDAAAARLVGISVNKTVSAVFFLSGLLAGVSVALFGARYPAAFPAMGAAPGLKAYASAVIGGSGSLLGAAVGGLLVGLLESFLKAYLEPLTGGLLTAAFADGAIYLCLLLTLLLRPRGLLGKEKHEKV